MNIDTIYQAFQKANISVGGQRKGHYDRAAVRCAAFSVFAGKTVIDFGCHIGGWSFLISEYADNVIGVDKKKSCIARSNKANRILNLPNVKFVVGDVYSLAEVCNEYHPTGLFSQKTLGTLKGIEDIQTFHELCWDQFEVIVTDTDFQAGYRQAQQVRGISDPKQNWIMDEKIDNLFIYRKP